MLNLSFFPLNLYFTESFSTSLSLYFPHLHPHVLLKGLKYRKPLVNLLWIELDHPVKPFMLDMRKPSPWRLNAQGRAVSVRAENQVQVFWLPSSHKCDTAVSRSEIQWPKHAVLFVCFRLLLIFYFPVFCLFVCFSFYYIKGAERERGLWSLILWRRVSSPPLPLFNVCWVLGLKCKLGGKGSCECWDRSEVGTSDPFTPPRKTHGQGGILLGKEEASWSPTAAHPKGYGLGGWDLGSNHNLGS